MRWSVRTCYGIAVSVFLFFSLSFFGLWGGGCWLAFSLPPARKSYGSVDCQNSPSLSWVPKPPPRRAIIVRPHWPSHPQSVRTFDFRSAASPLLCPLQMAYSARDQMSFRRRYSRRIPSHFIPIISFIYGEHNLSQYSLLPFCLGRPGAWIVPNFQQLHLFNRWKSYWQRIDQSTGLKEQFISVTDDALRRQCKRFFTRDFPAGWKF